MRIVENTPNEYYDKALRINPHNLDAWLGKLYKMTDFDFIVDFEFFEKCDEALNIFPTNINLHFFKLYSLYLVSDDDLDEIIKLCDDVLKIKVDLSILMIKGMALTLREEYDEIVSSYMKS
ncbi:hypothetical protein [Methanobrevibacter smithii]|uniref:hypothetical protein n=1 Tax=Methanobrevibacter smithii TaxID=2173 RepID=UPI0037DDC1A4